MSELATSKNDFQALRGNSPTSSDYHSSFQEPASCKLDVPKERRQPSITPRKFNRFFTPRSHGCLPIKLSRGALGDITAPANNHNGPQSSPIRPFGVGKVAEVSPTTFTREMKRRKLLHTPNRSPEDSGSEKQSLFDSCHVFEDGFEDDPDFVHSPQRSASTESSPGGLKTPKLPPFTPTKYIRQLETRGLTGQLLQLSLGSSAASKSKIVSYPENDWRDHTANFYSGPNDIHSCTSIETSARSIPFCATSCNTNSLVAVGDEEGYVRLLESAKDGKPQFKDVFLSFRPHSNAIIDMCFSVDDALLATASGDQTARVIDVTTQRTISVLAQHSASLKQVKFQPGIANSSVIVTSSRDGNVHVWDLRCKGTQGPIHDISVPMEPVGHPVTQSQAASLNYGCIVNSIYDAHRPGHHGHLPHSAVARDGPSRWERPGRIGDVSVTSITFLPEGQEHMLLTASEANASIKLWDVRCLHHTRRKTAVPLSYTALPESHNQWRHFGINSLNLNASGSRIYALCKDNTIYAYSTAHLILGQAPELSTGPSRRRHQQSEIRGGLGPLYGFRHRQLHATSFYVKAAIRPAISGRAEMLAVGSCDGCTILFPTDERYVKSGDASSGQKLSTPPRLRQNWSSVGTCSRSQDSIPISERGTPLVRGHEREVGALTWTSDGELVTVGDDFLVRCWREGHFSRRLRMGGEEGGQRWGCGWADVPDSYDDDDEDEASDTAIYASTRDARSQRNSD